MTGLRQESFGNLGKTSVKEKKERSMKLLSWDSQ